MFQKHQVHGLFEAGCLPEQFDTFLKEIGQKMRQCRPKNYFEVGGLKGGLKKNGFPQILISSKPFIPIFMSWDIDFGLMNPFPLLKLQFRFFIA